MEAMERAFKSILGSCNMVDCCSGVRCCHQFFFPCIKICSYTGRKVFYNYDGTEAVEPLVGYFKPSHTLQRKSVIRGMKLTETEKKEGLNALQQIAAVVHHASKQNLRVRAVGTGSSWSKLTNVRDILIDMTDLDKILSVTPQRTKDGPVYHIEVEGGKTLHDFVREIDDKYDLSLPCMGNYAGQTLAGIISTSTHGTGQDYPTMSNFVVAINMVVSGGVHVKVQLPEDGETDECIESVKHRFRSAKYGDPMVVIKSRDVFRAAAVGFGSLGVIYSVTLRCEPIYNIVEIRKSVEIDWPGDESETFKIPDELRELSSGKGRYFSFFVNPCPRKSKDNPNKMVLRGLYLSGERTTEEGSCQCGVCMDLQCCSCTGCRGKSACQIIQTDCSASCLQIGGNLLPSSSFPRLYDCGMMQFRRRKPYIQKWYNVLTFTNGNIHIKTAEYCIPIEHLDAALKDTITIMQEYGQNYDINSFLPVYVRMVKSDDLYLSPANGESPDGNKVDRYCYIEVPFLPGAYGIDEFHKKLEEFLYDKYKARPHWAKNNFLTINRVKNLYPNLDKWQEIYLLFNQGGIFDNEFTRKCGFDDFHHHKLDKTGQADQTDSQSEETSFEHSQHCPNCNTTYRSPMTSADTAEGNVVVSSQPQRQREDLFSSLEQPSEETVPDAISPLPSPQTQCHRSAETEVASSQLGKQTTV